MASKLSLLDVLLRHEQVEIGAEEPIDVYGVSAEDVGRILERYPNAFQQIADAKGDIGRMDQGLIGAVLAAGFRNGSDDSMLGDEVVEKRCRGLGVGVQMKLAQAIVRCTFPDGIGPFLEALASMSLGAKAALQVVVQVASRGQPTTLPQKQRPLEPPPTQPYGN